MKYKCIVHIPIVMHHAIPNTLEKGKQSPFLSSGHKCPPTIELHQNEAFVQPKSDCKDYNNLHSNLGRAQEKVFGVKML